MLEIGKVYHSGNEGSNHWRYDRVWNGDGGLGLFTCVYVAPGRTTALGGQQVWNTDDFDWEEVVADAPVVPEKPFNLKDYY